jgi:hypothetical protein
MKIKKMVKRGSGGGKLLALFLALAVAVGIVPLSVSANAEACEFCSKSEDECSCCPTPQPGGAGLSITNPRGGVTVHFPPRENVITVRVGATARINVSGSGFMAFSSNNRDILSAVNHQSWVMVTGLSVGWTHVYNPNNLGVNNNNVWVVNVVCGECMRCPCNCRNCFKCGYSGGRYGFGNVRGRMNADGSYASPDVQDALAILRQLVGLPSAIDGNEDARIAANIANPANDGNPSVQDALQILRKLVGLPNMIDNPELRPA